MVRKVVALMLISGAIAVAGCNTVRGAGSDLKSAANCTESVMHQGGCSASATAKKKAPPDRLRRGFFLA